MRRGLIIALLLALGTAHAGVLPDDRADVLYHLYDGGGVEIDGPSVLVRKKAGKSLSFVGNYYVDMISSASIDVITTASPYTEERTQWSLGMDYLRGNTTMRVNYTESVESDFDAKSYAFSVSQDMFGDLTTLTLSYGLGDDLVRSSVDPSFEEPLDRQIYGVGLTQILSKNLISAVNFETVTEEGFLNNPYRVVRYLDPTNPRGFSFEPEVYPNTRTTTAIGLRARYFLPYRAAVEGEYRWFTDTWDIDANTVSVSYIHPWGDWTFTGKFRWHDQTGAHFYRDIFARSQETNFRGRDKELSPLTSNTISLQAAYEFISDDGNVAWGFIRRAKVTASLSLLSVDYHDFSDLTAQAPVGEEPLYSLDADIFQLYVSIFY
jgi:nuclear transport factor 2 (NTF2) superfamily protein